MTQMVALMRCADYQQQDVDAAFFSAMALLPETGALRPGAHILVKPNLLMRRTPDRATTTHPAVVEAVVRYLIGKGMRVTIADSPGGLYTEGVLRGLYELTGMAEVAARTGAQLNMDTRAVEVAVPGARRSHKISVMAIATQVDAIVSIGKIKTHGMTVYTGAVKNLFGLVPGLTKVDYHARFPEMDDFCTALLDIASWARPVLSVLDGIVGMEGKGPSGGNPRAIGALVVGTDAHAVDCAGASLIGMEEEDVPTLRLARAYGLMPAMRVLGESAEGLRVAGFVRAPAEKAGKKLLSSKTFGRFVRSKPVVMQEKCVSCGVCVQCCPQKTIALKNGRIVFSYDACIRCYCCQELCPKNAIDVWQPFYMKMLSHGSGRR